MMNERDPVTLFSIAFGLSSVAGLASILRNGKQITWRMCVSATLNSGLFGMGVAMLWYHFYGGSAYPWFMLGVSLLAGLGGASLVDFFYQVVQDGFRNYINAVATNWADRTKAKKNDSNQTSPDPTN